MQNALAQSIDHTMFSIFRLSYIVAALQLPFTTKTHDKRIICISKWLSMLNDVEPNTSNSTKRKPKDNRRHRSQRQRKTEEKKNYAKQHVQ